MVFMNRKAIFILGVAFLFVLAFIWGNSLLSPEASESVSRWAGEMLSTLLGAGDGTSMVGGISVRKMGHFCEFFALGAVTWFFLRCLISDKSLRSPLTAFLALFVPLLDETIQIFSGRGPSIKDVWIDIAGFSAGTAAVILLYFGGSAVVKKIKFKRK